MKKKQYELLRAIIREEIGHNFKTKDNDPYKFYETDPEIHVEMYPTENGFSVQITVPENESMSSFVRSFPTQAECDLYARNYVDRVRGILSSRNQNR